VYEEAGWDAEIYERKPTPPLRGAQAAWLKKILKA
jgi:hypothetical protein